VSGNARFLRYLHYFVRRTVKEQHLPADAQPERIGQSLRELLAQRILVLDGAMGTMLQHRNLTATDFGGAALEGCNEKSWFEQGRTWCWTFNRKYLEAERTYRDNTFGGAPLVLGEMALAAVRAPN